MIEFASPFLIVLIFLPVIMRAFLKRDAESLKEDKAIVFPFFKEISNISGIRTTRCFIETDVDQSNNLIRFMRLVAWISLIVAVMRPLYIGEWISIDNDREGRNLMLAIDVSGSMDVTDFKDGISPIPSKRIDVAKKISAAFLNKRQGDRVGLVVFGSTAEEYVPLTYDVTTATEMLREIDVGLLKGQTAIGDAIGVSLKAFKEVPAKSSVLILLSDGASNAGFLTCEEAARIAQKRKVKIYTIGIGGNNIDIPLPFGQKLKIKTSGLDEKTLKMIANRTGGEYFRASDSETLKKIYDYIDKVEKIKDKEAITFRPQKELFYWPLALSFFLFAIVVLYKAQKV